MPPFLTPEQKIAQRAAQNNTDSGIGDILLGGLNAGPPPRAEFGHAGQIGELINSGYQDINNRGAPQLDATQQAQFRAAQLAQLGQLQGIASGAQQGAGEMAARRQVANAMAQQQAMARMARGGNALLAGRQAARNTAGLGLAGAGMAQQAALQDQMGAQGMLAQVSGQGRGQDLQLAGQNAGLQSQAQGQKDSFYLGLLQQLTGMDQATLAAKMAAYQAKLAQPGLLGPLLSMGGQIGAAAAMSPTVNYGPLPTSNGHTGG